jgi:hypothetical protein
MKHNYNYSQQSTSAAVKKLTQSIIMKTTLPIRWIKAFVIIPLLLFALNLSAQTTRTWATPATGGAWNVAGNWSPSGVPDPGDHIVINPSAAITITAVPTLTIGSLKIGGTGNVNLTGVSGNIFLDINGPANNTNFEIVSNATLQLTGTGTAFTLRFNPTQNQRGQIDGTLQINALGHLTLNTVAGTVVTVGNSGKVINNRAAANAFTSAAANFLFNGTASYEHIVNGSNIPTATWSPTSEVLVTGMAGTVIASTAQSFGNFTWDCASQSVPQNLAWGGISILGNVTISRTGSSNVALHAATATVTIRGNLLLQGGTLNMSNSGNTTFTTLNLEGNLTQNNAVAASTFQRGTSTVLNTLNFSNAAVTAVRNYNRTAGTYNNGGINTTVVAGVTLNLNTNLDIATGCTFTNSGTLVMGTNLITGAGTFSLANNSTLSLGNTAGITTSGATGNIQTATRTTLTSATGVNLIYTGTGACNTGNAPNAIINNLTVSLATGVSTLALTNATTITTTLTLNQGVLTLGNNNLTLNNTALTAIAGNTPSATNMVAADGTGYLRKNFPTGLSAPFTFPIGDVTGITEYSPVTFRFNSTNASTGFVNARVVDAAPPAVTNPSLSRYFIFETTFTAYNYNLSFNYLAADISGAPESGILLSRYDGSAWTSFPSTAASNSMTGLTNLTQAASSAPLTNTNFYGGNGAFTAGTYYRSVGNGIWSDIATWQTANNPSFTGAVPASAIPTNANSVYIEVQPGHTVDLTGNNQTFLISDLLVRGTLRNQTIGTVAYTVNGSITIANGGTYNHNRDGGALPSIAQMNWATGSTCLITGVTATSPTNLAHNYHHFIWNSTGQTVAVGMGYPATTPYTITGDFTVNSTGSANLQLTGTISNITINGNVNVNGGVFYFQAGAANTIPMIVGGNVTVASSAVLFFGSTGYTLLSLRGNLINNGTINSAGNISSNIFMNGTVATPQSISGSGTWLGQVPGSFRNITVNNSGGANPAVLLNTNLILDNGLFLLNGSFGTSNASALTIGNGTSGQTFTMHVGNSGSTAPGGNIHTSLNVNYNLDLMTYTAFYYSLSPSSSYTTGKELPSGAALPPHAGVVTIDNSHPGGVVLGNDATVFTLTLAAGRIFHLNGNNLRLRGAFNGVAAPGGLNATVVGSKLTGIGVAAQTFTFSNQFGAPDIETFNLSTGGTVLTAGRVNNITINPGANLHTGNITLTVLGNITNNGSFLTAAANTAARIHFNGSTVQTVSGSGLWAMNGTGGGLNRFPGFRIENSNVATPSVVLNQSLALHSALDLFQGSLGTSNASTLTIGTNENVIFTTEVGNSTTTAPGGSIHNSLNVNYNLDLNTFNLFYRSLSPAGPYTTGKELPSGTAIAPNAGTVTVANTHAGGVTLSSDATVFTFIINTGCIFHLNGNNLRVKGNFTNSATALDFGLNSSVANSKLTAIGVVRQDFNFGNQTFSSVITRPDFDVYNSMQGEGARTTSAGYLRDVTVFPGAHFQVWTPAPLRIGGNLINNGTTFHDFSGTTVLLEFDGTTQQTISGSGTWSITGTGGGPNRFSGFRIDNSSGSTPSVVLNQNLALERFLDLYNGTLGSSNGSTLTLGVGSANTLSVEVGSPSNNRPGGSLHTSLNVDHNIGTQQYNVNYRPLLPAGGYTTGRELPSLTANMPIGGTMQVLNLDDAGVALGNDATIFSVSIPFNATLRLNGRTLRIGGNFTNSATTVNNTMGLDSRIAGSKLHFVGTTATQTISFGNQTFTDALPFVPSPSVTAPDLEISNIFYNGTTLSGARVTGTGSVNNVIINAGAYFGIDNVTLNVRGNLTNSGFIFSSGASTASMFMFNGTAAVQTVGGSGTWNQLATNPGVGVFPGIGINNTFGTLPNVLLNNNLILQNQLMLAAGQLGGSGTLTLGNANANAAARTFTSTVGFSNTLALRTAGGTIAPAKTVNYNLTNMVFNANYNNLIPAGGYTTGKELPSFTADMPQSGTVTILNEDDAGVTLGENSSVFAFTINTATTFKLNGRTLRLAGNFTNNATTPSDGMGFDSRVAGSKLLFVGTALQDINLGNQTFSTATPPQTAPDLESSNIWFNGSSLANNIASGARITATGFLNNITVNANSFFTTNNNNVLIVRGNIVNNGRILSNGNNTLHSLFFNGSSGAQTINGSGTWEQVTTNPGADRYPGFSIGNPDGLVLNQNVALQSILDLGGTALNPNGGNISGSGILTLGIGNIALTVNRRYGAINMTNPVQYNLTWATYNIIYNATAAASPITTGAELPPLSYNDYRYGTVTNNNTLANGGIILGQSASVNALTLNANTFLNAGANTLRVYGIHTTNASATMDFSNAAATLHYNGEVAQTMTGTMATNYTNNYVSNVIADNQISLTLPALQIGSSSINGSLSVNRGTVSLNNSTNGLVLYGTVSSSPIATFNNPGTSAGIRLFGSAGNMGEFYWTGYNSNGLINFNQLEVNITGINPRVKMHGNITFGGTAPTFSLTNGVVDMGAYTINYPNATLAGNPMLAANQAGWNGYFSFNGSSAGLSWTMTGIAANTYRWPIGFSVGSFRPVTIQTLAIPVGTTVAKIGYHGAIPGTSYSAFDIVNATNVRSNYIATLSLQGNIGTPNITLEYQNSDFNVAPSAIGAVDLYYYSMPGGSPATNQWLSPTTQTSNGTNAGNTTITTDGAFALTTSGIYPLNLGEINNDPGNATTNFVWLGAGGTNWDNAARWDCGGCGIFPNNPSHTVLIPQQANQPTILTTQNISVGDITIGSGAILTLAGTATLTVSGDFINNNWNGTSNGLTFSTTGSSIIYNGISKQIAAGNYFNIDFSGATTPILSPVGIITVRNTFTPVNAGVTFTGSTIWFNGATQTTPSFNFFNNVIFGNLSTTQSIGGQITIAGDMTINATTFNDGGFEIIGPGLASGKSFNILQKEL